MPFGIRSSAGSGRLLIACEANENIVRDGTEVVTARPFRRPLRGDRQTGTGAYTRFTS